MVDYLENFVDIHNHILPGIDDGAKDSEESIALINGFSDFGISHFIATPHIMNSYYNNDSQSINAAFDDLQAALLERKMKNITIEVSAEHMIDDYFAQLLEEDKVMPLKKDFLLVEMSFLQPPLNFDEAIIEIVNKGFYPILAHPERYNFIRPKSNRYSEYRKMGILFQLNLLSLAEYYDNETRKKAAKLIDDGFIDFLASDVHNQKHLDALKNTQVSKRTLRKILPIIAKTIEVFY